MINRQLRKMKFTMRAALIGKAKNKNNKPVTTKRKVPKPTFITQFCPNARKAFRIVKKHWSSIDTNIPTLRKFLRNTPRLPYKANPNLATRLVRAKLRKHHPMHPHQTP